ncbi:allantoate amidohydrolase [Gryllotalpicola protaetiae]|uniref:Allantoate amidohydrolase n=1 Tax=Gryllotalpicola protaetiae TaxID=2419771 RepID=A0A387BPD6_9MICO|nr:allantoate amidohydrolase [Gryllotalpicola protaetiae]AYG02816.1 allantoate amidohydrolase [Gryllotalpicola protaetiae]
MSAAERIMARADELGAISETDGFLTRTHLSDAHRTAAKLVAGWMREAGLAVSTDAAGNVCGRIEGAAPDLPAVVLGSHIDTVPDAGKYDGPLGVLLAIEAVARLRAEAGALPFALEVVAFSDEEGTRFGSALSGSRAFAGAWDDAWWDYADADGKTLRQASLDYGLDPARIGDAARMPREIVAYLEAHIEQGPYLEQAGLPLAIVSSIAAARRFTIEITGHAGHAGGTPYELRRDALVGASELVVEIERIGQDLEVIATVGRLQAYPGGVNVIPGRVELSLDLRAEFDIDRDDAWARIQETADEIAALRDLEWSATEIYRADAVACDDELMAAVEASIAAAGVDDPLTLWSRAGHDAMAVADVADIGMLFVRNGNQGVSHSPDEIVTVDDVAVALDAFEATVRELAKRRG